MVERLAHSGINNQRISHVESCFGNSGQRLREPGRVLLGEGVLTKLCRKKPKLRHFFLFNDILVYGNIIINKKRYNKQHIIDLKHVTVEDILDSDEVVTPDSSGGGTTTLKHGWLIISPSKSFAVYAQTALEKQEWMSHINRGAEDQRTKAGVTTKSTDLAPAWVPDNDADKCMRCKKTRFTALIRRHHCRKCGFVVCNACSTKRAIIPYQSGRPVRVCDACCREIQKNLNSVERITSKKKKGDPDTPVANSNDYEPTGDPTSGGMTKYFNSDDEISAESFDTTL